MAVAVFGTVSSDIPNPLFSSANHDLSHTIDSGQSDVALVGAAGHAGNDNISSVTWDQGGDNQDVPIEIDGSSGNRQSGLAGVANPVDQDDASHTLRFTYGAANANIAVAAVNLSGVDQTTPFLNGVTQNEMNTSTPSLDVTTNADADDLVIDALKANTTNDPTVGGGQTERWDVDASSGRYPGSTEGGGSNPTTMSWSGFSGSTDYRHTGMLINAAAAGGVTVDMDLGTLTFSGENSGITRQLLADMDVGELTFSGLNNTVTKATNVAMDSGSLTFAGLEPVITRDLHVNMDAGGLTFTGLDPAITRQLLIEADTGVLAFNGLDNTVTLSISVAMDLGQLSFEGLDPLVTRALIADMDSGSLTLNGLTVAVDTGKEGAWGDSWGDSWGDTWAFADSVNVAMDLGTFALNGLSADVTRQLLLDMDAGELVFTGRDADITVSFNVAMDAGELTFSGLDPDVTRALLLSMDAGGLTLNGLTATVDTGAEAIPGNFKNYIGMLRNVGKLMNP